MEDEAPPASMKQEALIPDYYDEEATNAATMEQSRVEEEAKWSCPSLDEVIQLTTMVADHIASLPPPYRCCHTRLPRQ
jgi:hypothetical protein